MNDQPVLALDVGGSSVKSALVVSGLQIVGDVCINTIRSMADADEILHTLAAIIAGHLEKEQKIRGVAFAFPGPFDYGQGICLIQHQSKYDALYGFNISVKLNEILGRSPLEMRYRNDAHAAILGEARYGAGIAYSRLLGLTLGTGLGSAFIVDGNLVTEGADVPRDGWLYSFPFGDQRADDLFSTRGLLARLRRHGIHATDIASAIQLLGDDSAILSESFASFGADLGKFLEPFISSFRADALLITGGIAETWHRFAPSLERSLSVPILKGVLGHRAALLGAAALYW